MKVAKVGILVLFVILEESCQLFTVGYDISRGFATYGLYYVEYVSFIRASLRVFVGNGCWVLSDAFIATPEEERWRLSFCTAVRACSYDMRLRVLSTVAASS